MKTNKGTNNKKGEKDKKSVNAQPTKELFISMLTKDVSLSDAISDLLDNSVDGARLLRPDKNYDDLWIQIQATKEYFVIEDNCGGITADNARDYAFRFGRAEDMHPTPGSIGRFGIGMKRALFKLGRKFKAESTAKKSKFTLEVDVNEWKKKEEEEWHFNFHELDEDTSFPISKRGTRITVTELDPSVSESFESVNFINKLIKSLQLHHLFSIDNGLQIKVNNQYLVSRQLVILQSKQLKPASWKYTFENNVRVKAYAGLHEHDLDAGGWYIFCNGRLVLGPDQSGITGWGSSDVTQIPKYHGQYDRFRGYVFFESSDAALLPWNTTKTGVEVDSPKWKFVRAELIRLMRPVCDFLNKIHQERQKKNGESDDRPLELAVEAAQVVELSEVKTSEVFVAPKSKPKKRPAETGHIQYYKPIKEINQVKHALGAKTLTEVGEKTFEYFLKAECE